MTLLRHLITMLLPTLDQYLICSWMSCFMPMWPLLTFIIFWTSKPCVHCIYLTRDNYMYECECVIQARSWFIHSSNEIGIGWNKNNIIKQFVPFTSLLCYLGKKCWLVITNFHHAITCTWSLLLFTKYMENMDMNLVSR